MNIDRRQDFAHRTDRAEQLAAFFANPEAVAEMLADAPSEPEWGDFQPGTDYDDELREGAALKF